ncbi:TPA: diphosphomevalonate decarboxylase [Streptococcus pyogenes]|uniref:diphosphomevalonate decarboxylase n=2 Tax=Streptococcus pyogenes TaxID=1314 RepID=A0A660A5M4_STRPY|nr:diphosphomevalonate decarboxylase [Streptococcus pyogenes]ABF35806.1 Diphosphomevalonate decarboxylase [Streptococcus pyogenes MGAS2096]EPZ46425.1 diphosphomevalonate decarboxylase [Streptococcus pyogenes GA40634]EZM59963.1 diphosphomevalonate decarboxylase [Streptococcus pyogenes ABC020046230]HEP6152933.1 diphosphomevalonate decarboxylase [Streptococcus pyogenes ABC020047615]HEP6175323.1 diphosphomevalonate decarboxylase [Streptococcus pyogenes ABC020056755]HEP6180654.1 diphosphomevalonat
MDPNVITVTSYANIAIIKYWGKENQAKMIPSTSSISLTLENMFTTTSISFLPDTATSDQFYINGVLQNDEEHTKISAIIDQFRQPGQAFVKMETQNNMPTAAGLSSSSSGLSALVKACDQLFNTQLDQKALAQKAKFASGSSSRSFFGPVAAWDKDSGAIYKVETDLKMAMIMLVLNAAKKPISSREGMKLCRDTSTTFDEWVEQSAIDYQHMLTYLKTNNFEKVGQLTEANALAMHATTKTANPPFSYLTKESYQAMEAVKELRQEGFACYFTMDAGPNVKVLCLEKDLAQLAERLGKNYRIIVSKTKDLPDV